MRQRHLGLFATVLIMGCAGRPGGLAKQIAADHIGVEATQAQVLKIQAKRFSDSSLGCPQPGGIHLQAITPGHKAAVKVSGPDGDVTLDVRVSDGNGFVCAPNQPAPSEAGSSVADAPLPVVELAVKLAAEHANVEPENVTPVEVSAVTFGNSSLGCEHPGQVSTAAQVPGHIVLVNVSSGDDSRIVDVRVAEGDGSVCELTSDK